MSGQSPTVVPLRAGMRLPPHNHDAEVLLLGAILANNRAYERVGAFLRPEHFADDRHGRIYEACAKLIERGRQASATTLRGYFEQDESLADVGGVGYLAKLAGAALTVINAGDHGKLIRDAWARRELLARIEETAERLHDADADTTAGDIAMALIADAEKLAADDAAPLKTARQVREQIAEGLKHPMVCDSTGIGALDEVLGGGLYPSKCVGLFGRFKSGKTLLGGMISHHLGAAGVRHAYVAAEMGSAQIEQRNIAAELGINSSAFLKAATRSSPAFVSSVGQAAIEGSDHVLYADCPGLDFPRLRRIVLGAILSHRVKGLVIDYLQLISGTPKGSTRTEHLERVCQWLADTANRRKVWILVLGQLNSEGGARHGEAPLLAFDLVAEIHRDETGGPGAWLETRASRYTAPCSVGSAIVPALYLDTQVGPRFTEGSAA